MLNAVLRVYKPVRQHANQVKTKSIYNCALQAGSSVRTVPKACAMCFLGDRNRSQHVTLLMSPGKHRKCNHTSGLSASVLLTPSAHMPNCQRLWSWSLVSRWGQQGTDHTKDEGKRAGCPEADEVGFGWEKGLGVGSQGKIQLKKDRSWMNCSKTV